jgi:enterochelin esterase family protein
MPTRCFSFLLLVLITTPAAAQDMPLSQILIDGEGWKSVTGPFKAIRALTAEKDGSIIVLQAAETSLVIIDGTGKAVQGGLRNASNVSGLTVGVDGELFFFLPAERELARIGRRASTIVAGKYDVTGHDLVVAPNKGFYCTVPDEGAVYLLDTIIGKKRKVADGIIKPTGLVLWPDQGTLVVGDAGGKHLYAFRIDKDGSLSAREGYYTLRLRPGETASGVGGLTVDAARRLYAATPVGVQVFDPTGRMSGVLLNPTPDAVPTAVAFGGADGDLLYAACGDRLFVRKTKVKSALMPQPRK